MIELGVTLDAIGTLRESRKSAKPDPVFAAYLAEQAGAAAINVQLRSEKPHIQERDLNHLRETVGVELNLVTSTRQEMARYALTAKPERVTFIPERLENASGGGLDVLLNSAQLKERVRELRESSILPAIHLDPSIEQVKAAHQVGALAVDLSAETYAKVTGQVGMARNDDAVERELSKLSDCARLADKLGLHVTVSHGLTLDNTSALSTLSGVRRVSVGHQLIARAVMVGMERAVGDWIRLLERAKAAAN